MQQITKKTNQNIYSKDRKEAPETAHQT